MLGRAPTARAHPTGVPSASSTTHKPSPYSSLSSDYLPTCTPACQVKNIREIDAVVDLTATAFVDEVRGTGMTSPQWQGLEKEHLINNPALWRHIGA